MIFFAFCWLLFGNVNGALSDDDKTRILDWHNEIRAETATGQTTWATGNSQTASNMGIVNWDSGLASVAQAWADTMASQCNMYHNDNRVYQLCNYDTSFTKTCSGNNYIYLGENVAYAASSNSERDTLDTINGWYAGEHEIYSWGTSIPSGTGHYTQMVWANTRYIGCGCTVNNCNGWVAKYCACNYYPGGNYGGQYMYNTGTVCTSCPGDLSTSCQDGGLCYGCMDPDYISSGGSSASSPSTCTNGISSQANPTPPPTSPTEQGATPSPTTTTTTTKTPTKSPTSKPTNNPVNDDGSSSGLCGITVSGFSYSGFNGDYPVYTSEYGTEKKPAYGPNSGGFYFHYNSYYSQWMMTASVSNFNDGGGYSGVYTRCQKDSSLSITNCAGGDWSNYNSDVKITSSSDCNSNGDDDDDDDTNNSVSGVDCSGFDNSNFDGNYPDYSSSFGSAGFGVYGPNSNKFYMHFNSYYNAWMITSGGSCITDTSSYCGLYTYCQPGGEYSYTRCDGQWRGGASAKVQAATASAFSLDTDDGDSSGGADTAVILAAIAGSILGVFLIGLAVYCCIRKRKQVDTGGPALNSGHGTTQNIIRSDD